MARIVPLDGPNGPRTLTLPRLWFALIQEKPVLRRTRTVRTQSQGRIAPGMNLTRLKKPLLILAAAAGATLVGVGAFAAWTEHRARSAAQTFCAEVKPGEAEAALLARALAAGADAAATRWVQPLVGPRWLAATFLGYGPRSRHLCVVTVEAGLAKESHYEWE